MTTKQRGQATVSDTGKVEIVKFCYSDKYLNKAEVLEKAYASAATKGLPTGFPDNYPREINLLETCLNEDKKPVPRYVVFASQHGRNLEERLRELQEKGGPAQPLSACPLDVLTVVYDNTDKVALMVMPALIMKKPEIKKKKGGSKKTD